MAGFNYYGKSTNNIIGTPLILVSISSADYSQAQGINRALSAGEPTISRPITNEYGTIADHLVFSYGLIKEDLEEFTEQEQIIVERWLTSPKYSSTLGVFDCYEEEKFSYFGLFTATQWINGTHGYQACIFTFTVNGSYPYKRHVETDSPLQIHTLVPEDEDYDGMVLRVAEGILCLDNNALSVDKQHRRTLSLGGNNITMLEMEVYEEIEEEGDDT